MKLSQVLLRQHIDFMFKRHWLVQGKRVPINTGIEEYLKEKGIPVENALEFVKEKPEEHERIEIIGPYKKPLRLDETHPDYKEKPCLTLSNMNVLLEGISQAQVLTKTIIAENKLPQRIEELAELPAPKAIHKGVKQAILSANIFDCEQKKLPKIKDPNRPAFNFPRVLGITDKRRKGHHGAVGQNLTVKTMIAGPIFTQGGNIFHFSLGLILTNKLLQLIEKSNDTEVTQNKYVLNDVNYKSVFDKEGDLIKFDDLSNILVTSDKPLKHEFNEKDIPFIEIPNLYPVKHTVTLDPEHFYSDNSKYPIRPSVTRKHPHTTWLHFNATEVSNIFETPVTPAQILGRSLTHAFTVASAYAKQLHGEDVKDLPEPIHINCIQTDGQRFHFGVLELNTLNVDGTEGTKNIWYCKNNVVLYDSCRYLSAIPVLENYNPKVYGYINAFYNS